MFKVYLLIWMLLQSFRWIYFYLFSYCHQLVLYKVLSETFEPYMSNKHLTLLSTNYNANDLFDCSQTKCMILSETGEITGCYFWWSVENLILPVNCIFLLDNSWKVTNTSIKFPGLSKHIYFQPDACFTWLSCDHNDVLNTI